MRTQVYYFISLALLLGGTTSATPIKALYEVEDFSTPTTTPSNPLIVPRAVCTPCGASEAEVIYPTALTPVRKWKRVCINICKKPGETLQLDATTKKYECKAGGENCKRAPGGACQLPKCTAAQDMFKGKCVAKCKAPLVRNPAGTCAKATATSCPPTQELVKGRCVLKCKPPMVRNPVGTCAKPPKCLSTQELVKGRCVLKCKVTEVRSPAGVCVKKAGAPGMVRPVGPAKCTAAQDLVKGKCVAKCARGKKRNAAGICK